MQHVESSSSVPRPAARAGHMPQALHAPRHAAAPSVGMDTPPSRAALRAAWAAPLRLFLDRGQMQHLYLRRGSVIAVREGCLVLHSDIWVHDHDIGPFSTLQRGAVHHVEASGHLQLRAVDDTELELVKIPSLWSRLWQHMGGASGRLWP